MTKRTTASDLHEVVTIINKYAKSHSAEWHMTVEWAYGKPRVYLYNHDGEMLRELSPRLSTGLLLNWLHAFEKGLSMGVSLGNKS